ncbi:MAG: YciI family protein [Alphaproteobacteria bacterium]
MEFLLLIYQAENEREKYSEADQTEVMGAYQAFNQSLEEAGVMRGGNALMPVAAGKTTCVREGVTLVTDGPFAETKKQLGGYYLIDCADLETALGWAAKIPTAKTGSIEVRPIMTFD